MDDPGKRGGWGGIVKYAVGIGLLAFVLWLNWNPKPGKPTPTELGVSLLGGTPVAAHYAIENASPGLREVANRPFHFDMLLIAASLCAFALVLTIVRWHALVRAQGLPFSRRDAFRLGLVGYFLNTFAPGSVGGDIVKAVQISREQSRRSVAVATIVIDRIVGLWAIVWFVALVGGYYVLTDSPIVANNPGVRQIVVTSFWVVGISTAVWVALGWLPVRLSEAVARRLGRIPKAGGALSDVWRAAWLYRRKPGVIVAATLISLVSHSCWVVAFHFAAQIFETPNPATDLPSLGQHLLIVPVGMTLQALFPSPGGVGGGEAAFAWLYTVVGRPAAHGILACLAQRIVSWSLGLLGYLIYSRMRRTGTPSDPALEMPAVAAEPSAVTPGL